MNRSAAWSSTRPNNSSTVATVRRRCRAGGPVGPVGRQGCVSSRHAFDGVGPEYHKGIYYRKGCYVMYLFNMTLLCYACGAHNVKGVRRISDAGRTYKTTRLREFLAPKRYVLTKA